jgi:hypothetical protein
LLLLTLLRLSPPAWSREGEFSSLEVAAAAAEAVAPVSPPVDRVRRRVDTIVLDWGGSAAVEVRKKQKRRVKKVAVGFTRILDGDKGLCVAMVDRKRLSTRTRKRTGDKRTDP